jgi:hypothetical protein
MLEENRIMEFIKLQISKIIHYLTRRRWLYKVIGWTSFLALLTELISVDINKYFHLDFVKLEAKYGQEITALIAYVVDKFASGPDKLTAGVLFFVVIICLYIDYRISTADSSKTSIWNLNIGFNNSNTTTIYNNKDEKENS